MSSSHSAPESPLESPSPPSSPDDAPAFLTNPLGTPNSARVDQSSSPVLTMTASSTPLGTLNAARRPPGALPPPRPIATPMNADIAAKMKAFSLSRSGAPQRPTTQHANSALPSTSSSSSSATPSVPSLDNSTTGNQSVAGIPSNFKLPQGLSRPHVNATHSSPASGPRGLSLAEKRGMKLPGGLPGQQPSTPASPLTPASTTSARRRPPGMTLSQMGGPQTNGAAATEGKTKDQSALEKYADFIDTKTGALKFMDKAVVHGSGIDFTSGRSFSISLDEIDTLDELGKGNYGTVWKVRHSRPKFRRQGQGLAGNKARGALSDSTGSQETQSPTTSTNNAKGTTGKIMAMKEIRLELEDAKFAAIIMELDILHRCISPFIVDFYGAFFQEGAVYICMEWMDGGSIDKLYGDGVPEGVLQKITLATVQGLKSLKEEHNIIHRDVKPTNILINTQGHVKICDFGVSGNLVASIAKTNIGCQSYMAPERISSGGVAQAGAMSGGGGTYSVQSDIWSLGLTIIESALGQYPYPPETYDNIFSQLAAIVDGEPPDLPADKFSEAARDFVAGCLNKIPKLRPTYPMLLQHAWLAPLLKPDVITEEDDEAAEQAHAAGEDISQGITVPGVYDQEVADWVVSALERRRAGKQAKSAKPALHAVALDVVANSPSKEEGKPVAVAEG